MSRFGKYFIHKHNLNGYEWPTALYKKKWKEECLTQTSILKLIFRIGLNWLIHNHFLYSVPPQNLLSHFESTWISDCYQLSHSEFDAEILKTSDSLIDCMCFVGLGIRFQWPIWIISSTHH